MLETKTELRKVDIPIYFELLGAEKVCDDSYKLDGVTFRYWDFTNKIMFDRNKVSEEVIDKLKELDDYLCLYSMDSIGIKYLETLVYIHGVLSNVRNNIVDYVKAKITELKIQSLNYELENKKSLYKGIIMNERDLPYSRIIKRHLKSLLKIIYPISIDGIEKKFNNLVYNNSFTISGDIDGINFKWDYYLNDEPYITCIYQNCEDNNYNTAAMISYNYGDAGGVESLSYANKDNQELLCYHPADGYGGPTITLDITNGIIKYSSGKYREAKEEDYEKITKVIDGIYKSLLNRMPYLSREAIEKEEPLIKKKKLI